MTVLQACSEAGILDPTWKLPLGAGGGSDNIPKDTAVMLALMTPEERKAIAGTVEFFIVSAQVVLKLGLYYRKPGDTSRGSVDNLIGYAVIGELLPTDDAHFILERGLHMNWTYSVQYPDTAFHWWKPHTWKARQDWYGRFVGFPTFVKLACGAEASEAEMLLFSETVAATCSTPPANTSDKLLLWLEFQVIPLDHWIVRKSYEYFQRKMGEQYGTLDKLMEIYYQPVNAKEHPFVTFSRGRNF